MISGLVAGIRGLNPGYFALVMATGIVSIAAAFEDLPWIARILFVLNNVLYAALWVLTVLRTALYRIELVRDLTSHATAPAFLTIVAATCVLGSQYVVVAGNSDAAAVLWLVGLALWVLLIYSFFSSISIIGSKPGIEAGLSGAWLLATVSTQSISVLATLLVLDPQRLVESRTALFVALVAYLLGCMFYLLIINLILYRFSFFPLPPEAMTPPYWINMGAVAITTLAGARLLQSASSWPLLDDLRPFLIGFTLFSWTTATWWIPQLLILGVWRHVVRHHPMAYHPQYWSIVFPLGMYAASTYQLARAVEIPFVAAIPPVMVYIALGAWLLTFTAMVNQLVRSLLACRDPRDEAKAN